MNMLFGPVKATFQLFCGDKDGAADTWSDFTKTNPIVVPFRATFDLIDEGPEEALKTFKTFGGMLP